MCCQPAVARAEPSKSLVLLLCDSCAADPLQGRPQCRPFLSGRNRARPSRQNHANRRSAAKLALGFHTSAVQLGNVFDDCQPETSPAELPATRFIGAIKTLEDAR